MKINIIIDEPSIDMPTSILMAAEQLFLRYGIRSVSIGDICDSMAVSRYTFYTHFTDKSTLLENVCKRKIDEITEKLNKKLHMVNALRGADLLFDEISSFNNCFSMLFFRDLELKYPYIYQLFVDFKIHLIDHILSFNIKQGIIEGVYRTDINENIMAKVWFDLIAHTHSVNYKLDIVKQHFIRGLLSESERSD